MFVWLSAHADEEAKTTGEKDTTPWWRTLKAGRELNEKYPCKGVIQTKLLKEEKYNIIKRGKK